MSTYRSPPREFFPLVPLGTKFYSKHRREELPGWRGPGDSPSPGLSLSVGRPYYVTDRGLYNSQPRYPRSRGLYASGYLLPQLRKPGSMLKVQLRSGRLDLAVEGSETERSCDPATRHVMDKSNSHHRHASGLLDLQVLNGGRLKQASLWPVESLQRINRSRSTAGIESTNCLFPRPSAARTQADWDCEDDVIQERKLMRRYRPTRQAPEILFQGPPPRVHRRRAHMSSMSTTVVGEGSQPYDRTEDEEEQAERDSVRRGSSQFTDTPSATETALRTATRRAASGKEEQRKDSSEATRRVASEKAACRWPADPSESVSKPSKRTQHPKKLRSEADLISHPPVDTCDGARDGAGTRKKPRKRTTIVGDMDGIQGGNIEADESGSMGFTDDEADMLQTQTGNGEKLPAGEDSTAATTHNAIPGFPSPAAYTDLHPVTGPSPEIGVTELPQIAEIISKSPSDSEHAVRLYTAERSVSILNTAQADEADSPTPEMRDQILSLQGDITAPTSHRKRRKSLTMVPKKFTESELMNLSFHSSSAIEERPDTEELSEVSSRSSGMHRDSPGQRKTVVRRTAKVLRLGKTQGTVTGGHSPNATQRRPESKSSPGLKLSRGFSGEQSFTGEDFALANTLRQPAPRSSSQHPSDPHPDRPASDNSEQQIQSFRPSTSVRRPKPKQSLHPMRNNVDLSPTSQGSDRSQRVKAKEESTSTTVGTKGNVSEKPGSTEKSTSNKSLRSSKRRASSRKSEAGETSEISDEKQDSYRLPLQLRSTKSVPRAGGQAADEGINPLDVLVHNISSSVLTIINSLLASDPELLRAKLQPILERTESHPPGTRRGRIGLEPSPVKSQTLPRPDGSGLGKSESLNKVSTLKRKPAEAKGSPQHSKLGKLTKKPISLATRTVLVNAKDVIAKKPVWRHKGRRNKAKGESSRSSSRESSVSEEGSYDHPISSQYRMAEYEQRQFSFLQKLAQNILSGPQETESPQPLYCDSDDEEYQQAIKNKGFDVHRRIQSMFELMRLPIQNVFTVAIEKELRKKPPPSRETILPEEIIVDRKNRDEARLIQKFYAKVDTFPTHNSLMSNQEGTLYQLDHRKLDPHEVKDFYIRLGRLKRHEAARKGVRLNAQPNYTFSHLEMRYYLNKYAALHPRKRLVLPPIRSRLEDTYSERIYGRLKNDSDGLLFPRKPQYNLRSLEASLEELEQVSQVEGSQRSSL